MEFVDPFFAKTQSENVTGTLRKPGTKDIKRLLIVSGNHDSAREDARLGFLGYLFYFISATFFLGFLTLLVMSTIQLAGTITGSAGIVRIGTLGWLLSVYPMVPSILLGLFSIWAGKNGGNVPEAVDNLSASALAVALCRFLVKNPTYILEDTEIRFISFGRAGHQRKHLGPTTRLPEHRNVRRITAKRFDIILNPLQCRNNVCHSDVA